MLNLLIRLLNPKGRRFSRVISCLFCLYKWMFQIPDFDRDSSSDWKVCGKLVTKFNIIFRKEKS